MKDEKDMSSEEQYALALLEMKDWNYHEAVEEMVRRSMDNVCDKKHLVRDELRMVAVVSPKMRAMYEEYLEELKKQEAIRAFQIKYLDILGQPDEPQT